MRYIYSILLLFITVSANAQPGRHNMRDGEGGAEGRNILSFTPFCGIVGYGKFNPGAGFDYEYIISKKAGIGLHIPVMLGYEGPEQGGGYGDYYTHTSFYAAPGILFHATDGRGGVDFATGPAILIGNIHFKPSQDPAISGVQRDPYDYNMVGLLADNTINFQRRHFLFGFDVRLGAMVDTHDDSRFFIHFGMHFGGKF